MTGRNTAALKVPAHANALHGVAKVMDFQGGDYAALYLDRQETVADLKMRGSRIVRVRDELKAQCDQILSITEFMHPRFQKVCETPPAGIGRRIPDSKRMTDPAGALFHAWPTGLRCFLAPRTLAKSRGMRPLSLRYIEGQERIEYWLEPVRGEAARGLAVAFDQAPALDQRLRPYLRAGASLTTSRSSPNTAARQARLQKSTACAILL